MEELERNKQQLLIDIVALKCEINKVNAFRNCLTYEACDRMIEQLNVMISNKEKELGEFND